MFINNITKFLNKFIIYNNLEFKNKILFGFWIYLMSDCIIFTSLFIVYNILVNNIFNGPSGKDIFNLYYVLIETLCLLFSSITYTIVIIYLNYFKYVILWLCITFIFGLLFILMEFYEFYFLIIKGLGPNHSAFLSSFFILLGTHGVHVLFGLIWIFTMIFQIYYNGLNVLNKIRLKCLSLFWHFLDIIWICLYTLVYLLGSIK